MVRRKLRDSFTSGLIIIIPLLATFFILKLLFDWTLLFINPMVDWSRLADYTGGYQIAAQAVALTIVVLGLTILGLMASNRFGRKLIGRVGKLAHLIPVFRTLYFTIKQVTNAVTEQEHRFRKAVMIEYPDKDLYRIGFVTSEAPEEIQTGKERNMLNVFLPQSPNPTAGALAVVPEKRVEEIDMSVKKALKLLMTSGMTAEKKEIPEHILIEEEEQ